MCFFGVFFIDLNSDQECRLPVTAAIIDGHEQKLIECIYLVFDTRFT